MKNVFALLTLSLLIMSCQKGNKLVLPEPVTNPPPVVVEPTPENCQKDEKIHFVVCDSAAVEKCKYHTDLNSLLAKAKAEGFKNCITYRGTEVMSGAAPCMACKKPGYND